MNQTKKILIIDDEQVSISPAFDLANAIFFNGELKFEYKPRSQDVDYLHLNEKYNVIVVDITLANKSEKDGYGVLKEIINNNLFPPNKIFILTGNSQVNLELHKHGISHDIKVVEKPVTFSKLADVLNDYLTVAEEVS